MDTQLVPRREQLIVGFPASLHIRFREYYRRGGKDTVGAIEPECLLGDYLLYNDREAAPTKSQQRGYLNKTGTVTSPIGMTVWMGGNLNLILPDEELPVIIDYTERENQSSPGMSPLIGYPMLKIYTYMYTRSTLRAASEPTLKDYKDPFALR